MINFSSISKDSLLGKLLRLPLRLIPSQAVLPIFQGPLRGKKWVVGSGTFGYLLGTYEFSKQERFKSVIHKGDTVFDVGAHAGFYTLLARELVGEKGVVYAFEPIPRNLSFLKRNVSNNKYTNVHIVEGAVTDAMGTALFEESNQGFSGQMSKTKDGILVKTFSIDAFIKEFHAPPPQVMKIDVEGAEMLVLRGAKETLKKYMPTLLLAVHTEALARECANVLRELGYSVEPLTPGEDIVYSGELFAEKR